MPLTHNNLANIAGLDCPQIIVNSQSSVDHKRHKGYPEGYKRPDEEAPYKEWLLTGPYALTAISPISSNFTTDSERENAHK